MLPLTLSCRSVVLPRTVHRVMLSRRSVRGSLRYFYVPTIRYNADVRRPSYRKRPVGLLLRGATSADIVADVYVAHRPHFRNILPDGARY